MNGGEIKAAVRRETWRVPTAWEDALFDRSMTGLYPAEEAPVTVVKAYAEAVIDHVNACGRLQKTCIRRLIDKEVRKHITIGRVVGDYYYRFDLQPFGSHTHIIRGVTS